jgi:glycosyltransferase involved in cell wall biosynthesis
MISVVILDYNEVENLETLHAKLDRVFVEGNFGPVDFVSVDDGSRDRSWDIVRSLAGRVSRVRAVRLRRNFGKAAALTAGFRKARSAFVFTLGGDLQDAPAEISRFLAKLNEGLDVVSGWKQGRYDPWHKVYPSRVFNRMASVLTNCHLHDHNCGFKVYRREVLAEEGIISLDHRWSIDC